MKQYCRAWRLSFAGLVPSSALVGDMEKYAINEAFANNIGELVVHPKRIDGLAGGGQPCRFGPKRPTSTAPTRSPMASQRPIPTTPWINLRATAAHHLIPWQAQSSQQSYKIVEKAAKGGFNINGKKNGIQLLVDRHVGDHTRYNDYVLSRVQEFEEHQADYTNEDAADLLRNFADALHQKISSTTEHINELF